MKALNRYKYHLIAALILLTLLLVGAKTRIARVTKSSDELPRVGATYQLNHALELLPSEHSTYALGVAGDKQMRAFILATVKKSLPIKFEDQAFEIARSVIVEANHHKMDPLFLLAVIQTESQFNLDARGSHGEIGLMQVLPKTAKWLAKKAGLPKKYDLRNPSINIRIGATYFAHLRSTFHRNGGRYIAAYNMGIKNVSRLVKTKTEPQLYPTRVLNNYSQIYAAINEISAPATRGIASVK